MGYYNLIISEEVLHAILIELHLQVSSFNYTNTARCKNGLLIARIGVTWRIYVVVSACYKIMYTIHVS